LTGAVLLFGLLLIFPKLHAKIAGFCHTLVRNLLLFYVPASVGIMKIFGDVAKQGLLLVAVIVVTTWATALVAAVAFDACRKKAA
jgi:holin-like protein